MAKRVALLIDGGHLRVLVRKKAQRAYDPAYIEKVTHACILPDEELFRAHRTSSPDRRRGYPNLPARISSPFASAC